MHHMQGIGHPQFQLPQVSGHVQSFHAQFGNAQFEGSYSEGAQFEALHHGGGNFSSQLAGRGSMYGRGHEGGGGAMVAGIANNAGFKL